MHGRTGTCRTPNGNGRTLTENSRSTVLTRQAPRERDSRFSEGSWVIGSTRGGRGDVAGTASRGGSLRGVLLRGRSLKPSRLRGIRLRRPRLRRRRQHRMRAPLPLEGPGPERLMNGGRVPLLEWLRRVPSGRPSSRARRRSGRATAAFMLLFTFTIPVSSVGAFTTAASAAPVTPDTSTAVAPTEVAPAEVAPAAPAPSQAPAADTTPEATLNPAVFGPSRRRPRGRWTAHRPPSRPRSGRSSRPRWFGR